MPGFGRDVRRGGKDDVILFLFREGKRLMQA